MKTESAHIFLNSVNNLGIIRISEIKYIEFDLYFRITIVTNYEKCGVIRWDFLDKESYNKEVENINKVINKTFISIKD